MCKKKEIKSIARENERTHGLWLRIIRHLVGMQWCGWKKNMDEEEKERKIIITLFLPTSFLLSITIYHVEWIHFSTKQPKCQNSLNFDINVLDMGVVVLSVYLCWLMKRQKKSYRHKKYFSFFLLFFSVVFCATQSIADIS